MAKSSYAEKHIRWCHICFEVQSIYIYIYIYRLHLCRGIRPPTKECPGYDTKQSDGEDVVMLELCGMQSTRLFPSLQGPLWFGVVASDRVLSMSQIELNCVLILNWIVWNRTVLAFNCVKAKNLYLCCSELFRIKLVLTYKLWVLVLNWIVGKRTAFTFNWM